MAQTALNQDVNIQEFVEILKSNKLDSQYKDFTEMLGYVSDIESKFKSALSDVTKLEKRVNEMENKQFKNVCMKMVNNIKATIHEVHDKLGEIKSAIISGAKQALTAFRENGISALNSVMKFFHIRDGLNSLKESVDKSIVSANKSINKIEQISNEIHAAGSHRRNIGRIIMGKEQKDDIKANGNMMKIVQLPFKAVRMSMNGVKKTAVSAVTKLDNLDKAVQINKEKKPSLLAKVKRFNPPVKAENADKTKKIEASID